MVVRDEPFRVRKADPPNWVFPLLRLGLWKSLFGLRKFRRRCYECAGELVILIAHLGLKAHLVVI